MSDLRKVFADLGLDDVSTYLQSGNVLFESSASVRDLKRRLEQEIGERLATGVSVLLRTKRELATIVEANPFAKQDVSKLHVTFLEKRPAKARAEALDPAEGAPDEFRLRGREAYLYFPGGYGHSKLSNAYFEKKLGVVATTRNWKTVTSVAKLAGG